MKQIRIVLSIYVRIGIANFTNAIQAILDAVNSNPNFPTPNPPVADIQSNLNDLRIKQSLVDQGDLGMVPLRNQIKDTILAQIYMLANYVLYQSTSTSTTAEEAIVKIESANFAVARGRGSYGILPGVTNLRAKNLSYSVELEWSALRGAHAYSVMMTTGNPNDPQVSWQEAALSTRCRVVIPNLNPGQAVAFKIYALGSAGKGQPSDIVTAMAVI